MNDQTAQMGFQVGQKAVMAGQEYMEQSVHYPRSPFGTLHNHDVELIQDNR